MSLTSHSRVGKIHVAPCSCELHVRIRELEAELAEWRDGRLGGPLAQFATLKARAEKAEARVAELEKKMWLYVLYVDKNTGGDGLTDEEIRAIIEKPLPFTESLEEHGFIEKVEREAD